MQLYKQIIISYILIFLISGCTNTTSNKHSTDNVTAKFNNDIFIQDAENPHNPTDLYEIWFSIGKKSKELDNIPNITEPIILVNGQSIIRKTFELEKIFCEYSNSKSLKERMNLIIRNKVVQQEAIRMKIEPSQAKIDTYITQIKNGLSEDSNSYINGYIAGMGISLEEYFDTLRKIAYNTYQREDLWQTIVISKKEEITAQAIKRDIPVNEMEAEYYNQYVDNLIKKATIEYVDPEIEKLVS